MTFPTEAMGTKVLSVRHDKETLNNEDLITIITDRGILSLIAVGDCCSSSWFEHVENDCDGGVITEWVSTQRGDTQGWPVAEDNEAMDEYFKQYFPVLKTTKGRLIMELRNRSNGDYGGWIDFQWTPTPEAV